MNFGIFQTMETVRNTRKTGLYFNTLMFKRRLSFIGQSFSSKNR